MYRTVFETVDDLVRLTHVQKQNLSASATTTSPNFDWPQNNMSNESNGEPGVKSQCSHMYVYAIPSGNRLGPQGEKNTAMGGNEYPSKAYLCLGRNEYPKPVG